MKQGGTNEAVLNVCEPICKAVHVQIKFQVYHRIGNTDGNPGVF